MNHQELQEYNAMIRRWSAMVRRRLNSSVLQMRKGKKQTVTRGTGSNTRLEFKLKDSLSYKPRYDYGQVDSVSYRFERHGIFVHKGVGRGHIMSGGIVVRGRKASLEARKQAKSRNQKAENIILTGPIRRHPVDWFNPVIDKNIPELADKVAQMNADAAVNALRLRIV